MVHNAALVTLLIAIMATLIECQLPVPQGCFGGRIQTTCTVCDIYCDARLDTPTCIPDCSVPRAGCTCPEGTFVSFADGSCVSADQCAIEEATTAPPVVVDIRDPFVLVGGSSRVCRSDEITLECMRCERTCRNRFLNLPCTGPCRQGCLCRNSRLRRGEECVSALGCPRHGAPSDCNFACRDTELCEATSFERDTTYTCVPYEY